MTEQTAEQFPCPPAPRTEVERLAQQVAELQDLLAQAERDAARALHERDVMRERVSEPNGCTHCGTPQRFHGRRYVIGVGMHGWERPTDEQVKTRMLARRAARQPLETERPAHGKLWSLLDWSFWGAGMGDVFRMPLADQMIAAVPAETIAQAEQIMAEFIERRQIEKTGVTVWQEQRDELEQLRARVAELEAERAKYVGAEPTIAEEMAYLSRCIDTVLELCDKAEQQASRWEQPLPVPEWVAEVRKAAEGLVERTTYPPALPWAQLMDDEDLHEFLGDLLDSLHTDPPTTRDVLTEVEKTCGRWRAIAEAQHAHNTAAGPDAKEGEGR